MGSFNARTAVLSDIRIEHRAHLESRLAAEIIRHTHLLPAVSQISRQILKILDQYADALHSLVGTPASTPGQMLQQELFNPAAFGHLDQTQDPLLAIRFLLSQETTPFIQTMYAQNLFIQYVYGPLVKALGGEVKTLHDRHVKAIFTADLFSDRSRTVKEETVAPSLRLGICKSPFYNASLPLTQSHVRAVDRHLPVASSPFYQHLHKRSLPFVAGVSGHTGSFLLGAACYGDFGIYDSSPHSEEYWKQYLSAIVAFLTAGGIHSFDEIACVGAKMSLPYERGNYLLALPLSLRSCDAIHTILSQLSEPSLRDMSVSR